MSKLRWSKRHHLIARWGVPVTLISVGIGWAAWVGAARIDPAAPNADGSIDGLTSVLSREVTSEQIRFRFEDVSAESGVDFVHFPDTRSSLLPEDMGSGLAWGDYDGDGDPDLFLVNFKSGIRSPARNQTAGTSALYRNDGDSKFTDVSADVGLDLNLFGLGAAWGDYDGDGDLDLYVTAYGKNRLMRNEGDRFVDVSKKAGVDDDSFGAGCAWGDYDHDGWIDLYVTNYVTFKVEAGGNAESTRQYGAEIPYTLNPSSYPAQPNRLYRNLGDGTFEEVAGAAGVQDSSGRSLGAVWFDFDDDGWIDLYVADDVSANGVYHNTRDGKFADIGASSLAADYRGAMGLAVGDVEGDGDFDLLVTHWLAQENALFENMGGTGWKDAEGNSRIVFMDAAESLGLGQISLTMVGWATGFADFDRDGLLDLWIVNGNTLEEEDDHRKLVAQKMQLFWHDPGAGFFEIGEHASPTLALPIAGRGGAQADFDMDGRVDLAVMVHGGRPIFLRNATDDSHHWLTVRLRQSGGNTYALGARVMIESGGRRQIAEVGTAGSYLSQSTTDLHFGLGDDEAPVVLSIRWPDGEEETIQDVATDQILIHSRAVEAKID